MGEGEKRKEGSIQPMVSVFSDLVLQQCSRRNLNFSYLALALPCNTKYISNVGRGLQLGGG